MSTSDVVHKAIIWSTGILMVLGFGSMFIDALTSPSGPELEDAAYQDPCTGYHLRRGASMREAICACEDGRLSKVYCKD